jgi:uncharacterized protein (TIGR03435 family)
MVNAVSRVLRFSKSHLLLAAILVPLPVRATGGREMRTQAPEPQTKKMAADADPAFEVATIKLNDSGLAAQGINFKGRSFTSRNLPLGNLISFAYSLHTRQVVGAPGWLDNDRYDITAVPDQEGEPSLQQLKSMLRKLLVDRLSLKVHNDKRELSAYVLTLEKNGPKLAPAAHDGSLPDFSLRPGDGGLSVTVKNATMGDFTGFLQEIMDRPVVNQTATAGRFDFTFRFMPDDSQFNGRPPKIQAQTETTDVSPGLFKALQEQVGLRLIAEKTAVNVLVIDGVERPSAN